MKNENVFKLNRIMSDFKKLTNEFHANLKALIAKQEAAKADKAA